MSATLLLRFTVVRVAGEFFVLDGEMGESALPIPLGTPTTGRLAECVSLIDPHEVRAPWLWERLLNAYPGETAAHLAVTLSNIN